MQIGMADRACHSISGQGNCSTTQNLGVRVPSLMEAGCLRSKLRGKGTLGFSAKYSDKLRRNDMDSVKIRCLVTGICRSGSFSDGVSSVGMASTAMRCSGEMLQLVQRRRLWHKWPGLRRERGRR